MGETVASAPDVAAPSSASYDAFISYSHAADGELAPALQAGLQSLGKPWYRRRALRVFRDKTSLSATPELWPTIERVLAGSRYFVLLASPEAARSRWVDQEVDWWRTHRSAATVFIGSPPGTWPGTTPSRPSTRPGRPPCRRRRWAGCRVSRSGST